MTGISRRLLLAGGATALALAATAARADQLDKIMAAKKLRVGTDTANPPFGMLDGSMQAIGSDVEVARALAALGP